MKKMRLSGYGRVLLLAGLLGGFAHRVQAQIDWFNYSTTYIGDGNEGPRPILMTAIPYNGNYVADVDQLSKPAVFRPIPDSTDGVPRPEEFTHLSTFDSSNVYFVVPCLHADKAGLYEFRVLMDGQTVLQPWSDIHQFTKPGIVVNAFKDRFAFLGGFKTTWGHYVLVDLREKKSRRIIGSSAVYWMPERPVLLNIYTTADLNQFLKKNKKPYDLDLADSELIKWKQRYPFDQLDSLTHLPKKLLLSPEENSVLFYLRAGLYKKEALEYQLSRNGSVITPWKSNDFDNNFIWLKNLAHGEYILQMRLRAQRHHVTEYPFRIRQAWDQTWWFRTILVLLILLSLGGGWVLLSLRRQRGRMRAESARREKLQVELRSLRSQLNPHFIFNALGSIQGLIQQNQVGAANRYLTEFGSLLRDALAAGDNDFTDLPREQRILDSYLQLEQLRFGFRYEIITDPDVPAAEIEIPALLLQPLVENAVKHGVSGLREEGYIRVRFSRENANFIVLVEDNGADWVPGPETKGYGLKLTRDRIQLINLLQRGSSISMTIGPRKGMTIESGKESTISPGIGGTTVKLLFKNWLS